MRTYEHCRAWAAAGNEVTVITSVPNFPLGKPFAGYRNKRIQREKIDGVNVIRVWTYMAPNAHVVRRSIDFVSFMVSSFFAGLFQKADVIVATSPQLLTATSAQLLAGLKRKPWIMEVRDMWPDSITAVGAMRDSLLVRVLRLVERAAFRSAARIVAVHQGVRDQIAAKGIPSDKISVVMNGTSSITRPADTPAKAAGSPFVVGYFGTHGMAQGLDMVLRVAASMRDEPVQFLFVGEGAEKSKLKAIARKEGLSNVIFRDATPYADAQVASRGCDVLLVPLRETINTAATIPSKVFSIAAIGRPCILTATGIGADLVTRYGAGEVIAPGDAHALAAAIRKLQADPALCDQLGANGLRLAADFNRASLANQMLEIIQQTAKSAG